MKKIIMMLLISMLVFGFTACGGADESANESEDTNIEDPYANWVERSYHELNFAVDDSWTEILPTEENGALFYGIDEVASIGFYYIDKGEVLQNEEFYSVLSDTIIKNNDGANIISEENWTNEDISGYSIKYSCIEDEEKTYCEEIMIVLGDKVYTIAMKCPAKDKDNYQEIFDLFTERIY